MVQVKDQISIAENIVTVLFIVDVVFFLLFLWIPSHFYKIPMLRLVTGGSALILGLWLFGPYLLDQATKVQ